MESCFQLGWERPRGDSFGAVHFEMPIKYQIGTVNPVSLKFSGKVKAQDTNWCTDGV